MKPEVMYKTRIEPKPMNTNYKTGREEVRVVTETIPLNNSDYQPRKFYNSKR